MFTLITVTATPGLFSRAGEYSASRIYEGATAAEALSIARYYASRWQYKTVGIRVGNRAKSPVLWVK